MTTTTQSEHHDNALQDSLSRFTSDDAMTIEMLDGFFAALHCTAQMILPSEYLPELWGGGEMDDAAAFDNEAQFKTFVDLVVEHWNDVGQRFNEQEVFLPALFNQDDQGDYTGNDWANGFLRGIDCHPESWSQLINDPEHSGLMISIFALAHEHSPDPELRPYSEAVSAQRREDLLVCLAASITQIYGYFAPHRKMAARLAKETGTLQRDRPKIGRNSPCPCGSGYKYKKCCGNVTVH